jgi:hypothetical protein
MPDSPRVGAGSILKLGDGASTEVFTAVSKVRSIDPIAEESPLVDSTNLDSTGREYIGGLQDGAEFNVTGIMLMDNATHGETSGMDKAFKDKLPVNFQLLPNQQSKKLVFSALVRSRRYGPFSAEGLMEHSWTLKMSGGLTVAALS